MSDRHELVIVGPKLPQDTWRTASFDLPDIPPSNPLTVTWDERHEAALRAWGLVDCLPCDGTGRVFLGNMGSVNGETLVKCTLCNGKGITHPPPTTQSAGTTRVAIGTSAYDLVRAPSGDRGNKFRVETLAANKSPVETSAAVRFARGAPSILTYFTA